MDPQERGTPEDFLKAIELEEAQRSKGQLKIFLGMAAGVGKTYAMLTEAHELKAEGIVVLIGIVETHGRQETEELLKDLDIVPEKLITYKEKEFDELDVDGVINLKPDVILIDELAHTNTPGAKHAKRWQDVIDILDHGISVYTTLNVQHIESLNDIVREITGISVRETIPDLVIEKATSIQLIDLTPMELLQRLKEGKVYLG
jgi:two-component system sensor histidine kinase KdpD